MIGVRFAFAEHHYTGPELVLGEAKEETEVIGLQISTSVTVTREKGRVGSFHLVIGRRRPELLSLPKGVLTTSCTDYEGDIFVEHAEDVYGERTFLWALKDPDVTFFIVGPKLGCDTLRFVLVFNDSERLHILTRCSSIADFTTKLAPYSGQKVSWWEPSPRSNANEENEEETPEPQSSFLSTLLG